jgi:hypothetical protein
MYLAFDPGLTTGWAKFDNDGAVLSSGQVSHEELAHLVDEFKIEHTTDPVKAVIYEVYRIYKHKAASHVGSEVPASQAIGIIKTLIYTTGAKEVKQPSHILAIAKKWTGVAPVGDHRNSHWVDAFNHGAYWLIKEGIRPTQQEVEIN